MKSDLESIFDEDWKPIAFQTVHVFSKKHYKQIMRELRGEYPKTYHRYGTSPEGYAYSCGCSHDCCGHLLSVGHREYIINHQKSDLNDYIIVLNIKVIENMSRNY